MQFRSLQNAERAIVDIRKLRDYCLNPQHDEGKHKAHLFAVALGMVADDAEALQVILMQVIKTHNAQLGRRDTFGQRYTLDFMLVWRDRQAIIRSGWIIEQNSDVARLTTCYPI